MEHMHVYKDSNPKAKDSNRPWALVLLLAHKTRTCSFSSSALILERAVKSIIWHINTNSITTITVNALATWQFQRC